MRIVFYGMNKKYGGLDNNGGSRSILLSAETLRGLGHKVDVVTFKDSFKWFKHKKVIKNVPRNTDVVIAISILDVPLIHKKYRGKHKLAYYSRPFESWQMPKKKIVETLRKFKGKVISNSKWQVDWLKKYGIKSRLVYSGINLDYWKDTEGPHSYIGGLINNRHKSKRSDLVKKYATVHLKNKLNAYSVRELYNKCSIWLAPTEKEGWHNCPAEAALCGCLIVCNRKTRNGMNDYATDETAMRYSSEEELVECLETPDFSKVPKMQEMIKTKIGSRSYNMKRLVKILK